MTSKKFKAKYRTKKKTKNFSKHEKSVRAKKQTN